MRRPSILRRGEEDISFKYNKEFLAIQNTKPSYRMEDNIIPSIPSKKKNAEQNVLSR
jgi:hypothetical protein